MIKSVGIKMTGSELRSARRSGDLSAKTRREASLDIQRAMTVEECREYFEKHGSKRVKRNAFARALFLSAAHIQVIAPMLSSFEMLVERFKLEGKPNPEASARASLANRARSKKVVDATA